MRDTTAFIFVVAAAEFIFSEVSAARARIVDVTVAERACVAVFLVAGAAITAARPRADNDCELVRDDTAHRAGAIMIENKIARNFLTFPF